MEKFNMNIKEINDLFPEYKIDLRYKCDESYSVRMIDNIYFIIDRNSYSLRIFNIYTDMYALLCLRMLTYAGYINLMLTCADVCRSYAFVC